MKKKLILFFIIFALFITGCNIKKFDDSSYESIIYQVLKSDVKLHNTTLSGYKYYLPKTMSLYEKNDNNSVINFNNNKVYLYVDIISYYHKKENIFKENKELYYSKNINYKDKFGYVSIAKSNDKYFIEIMYNYAKIEAYVSKQEVSDMIYNSLLILSSIKYNDSVIDSLIGTNSLNYATETYNIFEPKEDSNIYLEYVDKYDSYNGEIKDEDSIELNDTKE